MTGDGPQIKASVIICTYNRAYFLKDVIFSVVNQLYSYGQYEIIIVDNNSNDNTRDVVRNLCQDSRIPMRYIFEDKQGLSYARNKGIQEAQGEIVAFIDDDAVAEKEWLAKLVSAYDKAEVACAGGRINLLWLEEKPDWLSPDMEHYLGKLDYGDRTIELNCPQIPFGGNISFKKSVFGRVGLFSLHLGLNPAAPFSNEELDLCYKLDRDGWIIKYIPDAIIYHKVTPDRLRKSWFYHRAYWQGKSDARLDIDNKTNIYARLRQLTTGIAYRKAEEIELDNKYSMRWFKGYLHQLILLEEGHRWNNFKRLRALETLLADLIKISSKPNFSETFNINLVTEVFRNGMWVGGLGDPEGPYPQWNLPRVRWAKKSKVKIDIFAEKKSDTVVLSMSFRPQIRPSATMVVKFNGREMESFNSDDAEGWYDASLDLMPEEGWNSIELCFEDTNVINPIPEDSLFMLFSELSLNGIRKGDDKLFLVEI